MEITQQGQSKGLTPEDYLGAIEKRGSIRGAAMELNVDRKTVRDACRRHDIEVPTLGGIPEPLPSDD